jgi:pimeloyl-ACP methyl ester carboxylesterase
MGFLPFSAHGFKCSIRFCMEEIPFHPPHPNPPSTALRTGLPAGEGTEWLFLRGLVRESAHWDDFPERFAAGIPGVRVVTLDLPGNGRHWRLDSPLSIPGMMEFARREAMSASSPVSPPAPPPRFILELFPMLILINSKNYKICDTEHECHFGTFE